MTLLTINVTALKIKPTIYIDREYVFNILITNLLLTLDIRIYNMFIEIDAIYLLAVQLFHSHSR